MNRKEAVMEAYVRGFRAGARDATALADALEKAADTLCDAATAFHLFGKPTAGEAMRIAEKHSRAVLATATPPGSDRQLTDESASDSEPAEQSDATGALPGRGTP